MFYHRQGSELLRETEAPVAELDPLEAPAWSCTISRCSKSARSFPFFASLRERKNN
jgi:hypothetical protein